MWQLEGPTAVANDSGLSIQIKLAMGDRCVQLQDAQGKEWVRLWGLPALSESPLTETYVRDDDLVASYAPTQEFPFFTQLCWRLRPPNASSTSRFAMSLLISMRTDLLDTHPEIEVLTQSRPNQSLAATWLAGAPIYWGAINEAVTLIDFAAAEDCKEQNLVTTKSQTDVLQRKLFAQFLEKGVLRRARLFAAIAPASTTEQQVVKICQEFSQTELPLAT